MKGAGLRDKRYTGLLEKGTGLLEKATGPLAKVTGLLEKATGTLAKGTGLLGKSYWATIVLVKDASLPVCSPADYHLQPLHNYAHAFGA